MILTYKLFKPKDDSLKELEEEAVEPPKEIQPSIKLSQEEIESKVDREIITVLKKIKDPEIDLDIWTLGLIYNIEVKDKDIDITITFTSPMCPFGPQILNEVKEEIQKLGYNEPNVDLTFNPFWEPSGEVKEMLGVS